MATRDDQLKEELLESDEEYRRLWEEHQAFERRLEHLYQQSMLSPADEMEQKRIKLHKLSLKDQMEQILRARRQAQISA